MEYLFSKINLPNLKSSQSKNILINKKEKKEDNINLKNINRKDQYTLYLEFNKVYEKKKKEWKIEDEKIKLEKEKEKEIYDNTQNYLKEIQNLERKPQLYIDSYSKRDGITNERIEQFNKYLNKSFYNKKYLEQKLIDFNEKMEIEEAEKKLYESQLEKDYFEKKKTKEDYLEKEMNEKLRFNLKNTIDDKNVDFNYRVIGQKIKVKNKNDPYKEYLDFYHELINKKSDNNIEYKKPIDVQNLVKSNSQENIKTKFQLANKYFNNQNDKNENTKVIVVENIE